MDAQDTKERGEMNGGDDDADDDASITVCPTHCEALQIATTVQQFIEGMDVPYAWKLEVILTSFGHATRLEESRTMKDTSINDFFSCKQSIIVLVQFQHCKYAL